MIHKTHIHTKKSFNHIHYRYFFVLTVLTIILLPSNLSAHKENKQHIDDIFSVLPFDKNSRNNHSIIEWATKISKWNIDEHWGEPCSEFYGLNFGEYVKQNFNFSLSGGDHRLLFHWPYNAEPWNGDLAAYIECKCRWGSKPDSVVLFREALKIEQANRNRYVNESTCKLFKLNSSGKEGRIANGIAGLVYDVHLLGDWPPEDNTNTKGLTEPRTIARDIIKNIQRIDDTPYTKELIKKINFNINNPTINNGTLAKKFLTLLQEELPIFFLECRDGELKSRFNRLNIELKYSNRIEFEAYKKKHPEIFKYKN